MPLIETYLTKAKITKSYRHCFIFSLKVNLCNFYTSWRGQARRMVRPTFIWNTGGVNSFVLPRRNLHAWAKKQNIPVKPEVPWSYYSFPPPKEANKAVFNTLFPWTWLVCLSTFYFEEYSKTIASIDLTSKIEESVRSDLFFHVWVGVGGWRW